MSATSLHVHGCDRDGGVGHLGNGWGSGCAPHSGGRALAGHDVGGDGFNISGVHGYCCYCSKVW